MQTKLKELYYSIVHEPQVRMTNDFIAEEATIKSAITIKFTVITRKHTQYTEW